jgi:hypothetical protein
MLPLSQAKSKSFSRLPQGNYGPAKAERFVP